MSESMSIHDFLKDLAQIEDEQSFNLKCHEKNIQGDEITQLVVKEKGLLSKEDIPALLHIQKKLFKFYPKSTHPSIHDTISDFCINVLGGRNQSNLRNEIEHLFAKSPKEEKIYIGDLLERLDQKQYSSVIQILKSVSTEDPTFELVENLVNLIIGSNDGIEERINDLIESAPSLQFLQDTLFIFSLFPGTPLKEHKLTRSLLRIPDAARLSIISKIKELIQTVSKEEGRDLLLKASRFISKNELAEEWIDILKALQTSPPKQRNIIVEQAGKLFDLFSEHFPFLWEKFAHLETKGEEGILSRLSEFRWHQEEFDEIDDVISGLLGIPSEDWSEILDLVHPFFNDNNHLYREKFIKCIASFPKEQRRKILKNATFLNNLYVASEQLNLLETVHSFPQEKRIKFVQKAAKQLKMSNDFEEMKMCLLNIESSNQTSDSPIKAKTKEIVQSVVKDKYLVIERIHSIKETEAIEILDLILRVAKGFKKGKNVAKIIYEIEVMGSRDRSNLVEYFERIVNRNDFSLLDEDKATELFSELFHIYNRVCKKDPEELALLLNDLEPLFQRYRDESSLVKILSALKYMPQDHRKLAIDRAITEAKPNNLEGVLSLISLFSKRPKEVDRLLEDVRPLLEGIKNPNTFANILSIYYLFPKEHKKEIEQFFIEHQEEIPNYPMGVLDHLLSQKNHMTQAFQKSITEYINETKDVKTAELILSHHNPAFLSLNEQHPLYELCLCIVGEQTAKFNKNDPKAIFYHLKQNEKPQPVTFDLPQEVIEGQAFSLNVDHFQKRNKVKRASFKDLPKDINFATLTKFFSEMRNRIDGLNETIRERTYDAVKAKTECTFNILEENFLNSEYIRGLLSAKGEPEDPVPDEVAQFFAIVKFIGDESNQTESNKWFTQREDRLLSMSASIQNCPYGKSEGIAIVYSLLPPAYQFASEKESTTAAESRGVQNYIDSIVQMTLLNALTSDNSLMKEMTGRRSDETIPELAHHSLYLKNSIGPTVGLKHKVKYDPYVGIVSSSLLFRSREDNLKIFYKHYKPSDLINALLIDFNKDPSDKRVIIGNITRAQLFNAMTEILGEKTFECWDFKDIKKPVEAGSVSENSSQTKKAKKREDVISIFLLNATGASEILKLAGYIKT